MKILFITNLYPPNVVGGYEQLCFDVASAFVERGHEVSVLTSTYGSAVADYPGQQVFRLLTLFASEDNIYQPREWSAEERIEIERTNACALEEVCQICAPDVVFIWNLYFLSPAFLSSIERTSFPSVYFLTDNWLAAFLMPAYVADYFRTHVFNNPSMLRRILSLPSRWKTSQKLDGRAICSSVFMEEFYRSAGLRFTDTTVIHNGIHLPADAGEVGNRVSLVHSGELDLLFAGRVVEIKGLRTAILALPLIVKRLNDLNVKLTIVGDQQDSPFLEQMLQLATELGVSNLLTWATPVPEAELHLLFQRHDIYLFPSLYEPFSLTLLHAMATGIPIVSSRAGGNPEAIRDGYSGLLHAVRDHAALADAVIQLVKRPELRSQLASHAQQESHHFAFSNMVGHIEDYLESSR